MILIEWRLGFLLWISSNTGNIIYTMATKRYRKQNYKVREELSQLNANFQENLQGLEVVQMFRRQSLNGQNFLKLELIIKML